MQKRLISALIFGAMILSFTACGDNNTGPITVTDKVEDTLSFPAGIEKCDYGEVFNILAPDWGLYSNYFFTDGEQSDSMDKAIYTREILVEEQLGIDITYEFVDAIEKIRPAVSQEIMSGDSNYQLVLTHCMNSVNSMVMEEYLYDFNDFEYVDLNAEWWNSSIVKNLTVNGKVFYAVSDFMLPDPNCVLFNKDFIDIYKLEDPYTLVREGEWTLDKMMEMMSVVTEDNGDGVWDKEDTWGLANPNDWLTCSFIYSSGITLCGINEDNEFELVFGNERTYTLMDKLDKLINGPDTYNFQSPSYDPTMTKALWMADNRALFALASINWLTNMRQIEVDYGILPYPKLDAEQEHYMNNDWSGLMCVPKTVNNPEMVGKAIELLSYYSAETTIPAYYDVVLGAKLSRDDDSVEMLDIIFGNTVFDAGMNYFGFSPNTSKLFYTPYLHIYKAGQNNLASWIAKYQPGSKAEMDDFNEMIALMD